MVEFSFLFLELIFAAIWLIIRSSVWIKKRHIDLKREAVHSISRKAGFLIFISVV